MNKVGLVSVSIHNYGSLLQTYAMQKILDSIGLENDIILFKSDPIKQFYRIFNKPFLRMKLKSYKKDIITKIKYPQLHTVLLKRNEKFLDFKNEYCRFTPQITSRKLLLDMGKHYNAFILGSDQVWNPANLEMDFYTLNFVPLEKTKIAYASSFGVSSIPRNQIKKTIGYLNRIQYISVREDMGAKIVKDLIGRDVPVVCDPTALLTRKQWDSLKSNKKYTKQKYIFCYFLGKNPQHRKFAEKIKKETGLQIVTLLFLDEFVKGDLAFGDITPFDVGPQDFINLIAGAELVLTDSFHGTMFSIYYQKKFFTFSRYNEKEKDSTNSRIISILRFMGLENHKLLGTENVKECLIMETDWGKVQSKLDKFRAYSFEYLYNALKSEKLI